MDLTWDLCTNQNHALMKHWNFALFNFPPFKILDTLNWPLRSRFVRSPAERAGHWLRRTLVGQLYILSATARKIVFHLHRSFVCKRASGTNNSNSKRCTHDPELWSKEEAPGEFTLSRNHHLIFFPSFLKGKKELNVYFVVEKTRPCNRCTGMK